ncbi:hypothetical protein [Gracilimonas mengyeensis]|uniref:Uncharacterized protein n=1 Tax=Gracilimonas mengyeensis TaxID=1302730 RepID=A0A521B5K0_9BACT|nr:hypothetical protein [Gracilimonas mengyeensis]SMO42372.1 hypothetical protein SAMN06265219_10236 [Gracilimonas mengyeensis]
MKYLKLFLIATFLSAGAYFFYSSVSNQDILSEESDRIEYITNKVRLDNIGLNKSLDKRDIRLVFALENVSCSSCLNEIDSYINFIEKTYPKKDFSILFWFNMEDREIAEGYYESLGGNYDYSFSEFDTTYYNLLSNGNKLLFVSESNNVFAYTRVPNLITSDEEKKSIFDDVVHNTNLKSK